MMKYMVSVLRKNWGNWPFRCGKMLKKREKIRKFHSKNLATMNWTIVELLSTELLALVFLHVWVSG